MGAAASWTLSLASTKETKKSQLLREIKRVSITGKGWGEGELEYDDNVPPASMPSTILLLTARSTLLRASLPASTTFLRRYIEVVKDARGRVVRRVRERAAMRRVVASVRKDMVVLAVEGLCGA